MAEDQIYESGGEGGGRSWLSPTIILAFSLIIAGFVLGFVFDRIGSAEFFFSGLGLLLFKDSRRRSDSSLFRTPARVLWLVTVPFALGFSILLLIGSFELIFYDALPTYRQISSIIGVGGAVCLLVGVGPYITWMLRSAEKQK